MCQQNFTSSEYLSTLPVIDFKPHRFKNRFQHITKDGVVADFWVFIFDSIPDAWRFYKYRGHIGD
jgi:hypothetical protein